MILLELFLSFLKIGCFAFGGAYAAIPLIRDEIMIRGWMTEEMFSNIVAIAESTPGPIMVNTATYVGMKQGGVIGALIATLGVVLPAFVIILIVTKVFTKVLENQGVQAVLKGIKPTIMGIILGTGISMVFSTLCGSIDDIQIDWRNVITAGVLLAIMALWKRWKQKPIGSILFIGVAALVGMIVYAF